MIQIKNMFKKFGGVKALDNCSIEIKQSKITAIIGPNGSGKSTLFHIISHLIEKDSGKIYFNNKQICRLKDYQRAKLGFSRTFQEVRLFKNLTIKEHFEIAMECEDEKLLRSLFKKKNNHTEKIIECLQFVGLNKPLNTLASNLSYGQRKLLDLAVAIAKPHSILFLDEPVAGVNPEIKAQIKKIISELKQKGSTIVIIEHDMNFIMDISDFIYVMDYGKVIAQGLPKEIQNNKLVLDAYLGE